MPSPAVEEQTDMHIWYVFSVLFVNTYNIRYVVHFIWDYVHNSMLYISIIYVILLYLLYIVFVLLICVYFYLLHVHWFNLYFISVLCFFGLHPVLYVSLYLGPNKELLMCSFLLVLLLKSRFFDGIINLLFLELLMCSFLLATIEIEILRRNNKFIN